MLEIAREGIKNADNARKNLLLFLQSSETFTEQLEELARQSIKDNDAWIDIIKLAVTPEEIDELHGATARILESFPSHPGLLFINAMTRRNLIDVTVLNRAQEEFQAALIILNEQNSDESKVLTAHFASQFLFQCEETNKKLASYLKRAYAAWSFKNFGARLSVKLAHNDLALKFMIFKEITLKSQENLPDLIY